MRLQRMRIETAIALAAAVLAVVLGGGYVLYVTP